MRANNVESALIAVCLLLSVSGAGVAPACSTFMLAEGPHLVFGHNLNENGIDVPGMVFVNKRGVFKMGRTWSEMINKDGSDPSSLTWISRHGSVTFNVFGRDFPDGGINEVGLYIWEMSDTADYPLIQNSPKLMHMNWMQYILDNFSTIDEAIDSTSKIEIDGWEWHYFVADRRGKAASIQFIDGEVIVHRGETMPVPALLNEPYEREMELLNYFEGFGGVYPVDLDSEHTPRFAKSAVLLRDYDPDLDPVDYGFLVLKKLTVAETPKWSVIFDVHNQMAYFKTRLNPEIKRFSIEEIDFSSTDPVQILNIDIPHGGDVGSRFHPYDDREVYAFLMDLPLPDEFFSVGGLTRAEFCERWTTHWHEAERSENQGFVGTWVETETTPGEPEADRRWTVTLSSRGNTVEGEVSRPSSSISGAPMDHLRIVDGRLVFTFRRAPGGEVFEVEAAVEGDQMELHLKGMEDDYGTISLERTS